MSIIAEHMVGTREGVAPLLHWISYAQHRYYPTFSPGDHLAYALKVARVEDTEARNLMLELLALADRLSRRLEEACKEFETIQTVLTKIDQQLTEKP